ncbi:glycosyltransferase [Clostridium magnum]|uniref:GDP-mannose-dependent alpha-(1-6)-phosphatidylinositol monomannoside mannosyltransferase n=1 Tax=Clostridium magnum DSM 2767 TaxID=1121326 RepID=A0A162RPF4_9CLOT|nr:glycosyltransferase [Clostridium magnum]KZL90200.1 GDP-mannose-dependent alpha-(1-6)-phosphatidylinositol monomannoside mannosyltransferase [Clostridium magnum DSM 2767]SHH64284.1 Glycosyltransferase involved in cell wall bisynthesis [Clostridium magnum DSM 2767]
MRVAIVHEWFSGIGGSEKVVKAFHELFPDAPVYVFVHNKNNMPEEYNKMDIRTSYLQKIPFSKTKYQKLLPLMPHAVEQYDLSDYDLVISSSTCCAKGVITKADTLHICYCHTPMRYGWDLYHEYIKDKSTIMKWIISSQMKNIRLWDKLSSDRVDCFLANSNNVAKRIQKNYRRNSKVIYPPVDTDFYTLKGECGDYYLIVSRLVGYKRVDLAIEVFNELNLPLVIIGGGEEYKKYKTMANSNISFLGRLSDEEIRNYYRECKAFVFPGEEDFGITPVEAQACGRPVIAYGKGGTLETVIEGQTGLFFYNQDKQSLKEAVIKMEKSYKIFDSKVIRKNALRFSVNRFKSEIMDFVTEKVMEFHNKV